MTDPKNSLSAAFTAQEWNVWLAAATSFHLIVSPEMVNKLMDQLRDKGQTPPGNIDQSEGSEK